MYDGTMSGEYMCGGKWTQHWNSPKLKSLAIYLFYFCCVVAILYCTNKGVIFHAAMASNLCANIPL